MGPTADPPGNERTAPAVWRYLPVAVALSIGVAAGIGAFTFRYAEGLSYLRTDPRACVNCHIMQSQYDSWQKSSHHQVAVCVDCHLPHSFFAKYLAKAENGYRHGERFTTGNFAEPIVVQARGREILQENCLYCHAGIAHDIAGDGSPRSNLPCIHCHSGAGHGAKAGLGPPLEPSPRDPAPELSSATGHR